MHRLNFSSQRRNDSFNFCQITLDPVDGVMAQLLFQDSQLFQLFRQGIGASATVSDALIVNWRPTIRPSVLLAGNINR